MFSFEGVYGFASNPAPFRMFVYNKSISIFQGEAGCRPCSFGGLGLEEVFQSHYTLENYCYILHPKMEVWKMNCLFNWVMFRFRVKNSGV